MPGYVRGYTRHVNGKLVNVRAYEQSDGGSMLASTDAAIMAGIFDRPPMVGKPGIFTHGLVPIAIFPNSRDLPFAPTQLWIRKNPNMQGLGGVGLSVLQDDDFLIVLTGNSSSEWKDAVSEALEHVKLVIINNPGRNISEVINRPDVQDALTHAGKAGASVLADKLRKIWVERGGLPDAPYLNSVLNDVNDNAVFFSTRMTLALQTADKSSLDKILFRDRIRASAAQSVIETRASMEAKLRVYRLAGISHVKWVANYNNHTPCAACNALNETVVPIGEEFDHQAGNLNVPVYFDLTCPPRHPNCKCRIVPSRG